MDAQITTPGPASATIVAHAIPNRALIRWDTPRDQLQARDLETFRDGLKKLQEKQQPLDLTRTPGQALLRFGNGTTRASLAFLKENGLGDSMSLTHHAFRALGREVLPGRGLDFLLDQCELGEAGRKLSDMSFTAFARANGSEPRMFRTVMMTDPATKEVRRTVRSIHSSDYATYDNLQFVEDLLSGGYGNLPLVSITHTDQALRFRFLAPPPGMDLANLDGQGHGYRDGSHVFLKGADGKSGIPMPSFECWNSEVGQRAVTIRAGMFRLICTNSAGHWDDEEATWRWIHRGDRARIREGVKGCMTEARVKAAGVVEAYETALNVAIDDAYAWFERATKGSALQVGEVQAVEKALHDPTTTPGGLLASVVDAVTLVAQDAVDEFDQERIEMVGARLLQKGLAESLKNGGRLTFEV
jgi:hypothetical protein